MNNQSNNHQLFQVKTDEQNDIEKGNNEEEKVLKCKSGMNIQGHGPKQLSFYQTNKILEKQIIISGDMLAEMKKQSA